MENPSAGIGTAAQAYAEFAGKEQVLSLLSAWPPRMTSAQSLKSIYALRSAKVAAIRGSWSSPSAGLVDYWQRSKKRPDFCSEADRSYDCKAVAAKVQ